MRKASGASDACVCGSPNPSPFPGGEGEEKPWT